MSSQEMQARLQTLVITRNSCSTCTNRNTHNCRYYRDENNIPVVAGERRCIEHSSLD